MNREAQLLAWDLLAGCGRARICTLVWDLSTHPVLSTLPLFRPWLCLSFLTVNLADCGELNFSPCIGSFLLLNTPQQPTVWHHVFKIFNSWIYMTPFQKDKIQ